MEGILWKWTNYFTGWQPRWFVLDTGILSYYKSQEDVNNGCKGSIKMSVCDVIVHPTDRTRLDLIIPGEAHFYVKSATPQERQQWLVALGSCKACLRNGRKAIVKEEMSEDTLRAKKSELRLYCDLLMQQVHSVKTSLDDQPEVKRRLNEATSLLTATCDTFIATLEDCVRLANADAPYPNPNPSAPASPNILDATLPPSPSRKTSQNKIPNSRPSAIHRSTSSDRNSISSGSPHGTGDQSGSDGGRGGNRAQRSARSSISRSRTPSESSEVSEKEREREAKERLLWDPVRDARNAGNAIAGKPDRVEENDEYYDDQEAHRDADRDENLDTDRDDTAHDVSSSPLPTLHTDNHHRVDTLFSKMSTSFMDIKLETDGGIPVAQFLDSCENVLIIFDKLSPTAFAPIKMDISRNARKIRQKYSTDTTKFATLQMIINYEVEHSQDGMEQSATISLIWLKRAMMFIREFLAEVHTGSLELEDCAYNAYQRTLRHFHGFVIRGVFAVAVKSVPFRKDFLVALLHLPEDAEQPGYQEVVLKDMEDYITAQGVLIKIIDDYLTSMHIDHKTIV